MRFQVSGVRKDKNKGEELTPEKLAGSIGSSKPRTKVAGEEKIGRRNGFLARFFLAL